MGNHQNIGRRMVLQSGGERLNPSATVDEKVIKASALVTRVGRRKAFKSEDESPNPSTTGKINTVKGFDLKKLEVIRKYISREKTGNHDQKLVRNGGIKD